MDVLLGKLLLLICAVFVLRTGFTVTNALSSVTLKDGQYNGIVVAISPKVPELSKDDVIEGIKRMFTDANNYLYEATMKMATFGRVTILVPRDWTGNYDVATHETWNDADIRVGPANPQYGDQPYTLQPGVCGEQSSYIHFTPQFFKNKTESIRRYGPLERILVHEWAHFRYGVFDEYGYPGDAYYPAGYSDGYQLLPTACSNVHLEGQLSEACHHSSPTDPQCKFYPNVNQQGVSSSIMSLHFLPHVTHFCDKGNHNPYAPTKHNALCGRRSVWDVISSHPDFSKTWVYAVPFQPTFRVVRQAESRYVLVLDCSSDLNDFVNQKSSIQMQRISFVRSAAVSFIEENLPDGTWLSLIAFGPNANVLKPLQQLNSRARKGFTNAVPRVTCGGPERKLVHAIREAISQLDTRYQNRTDGTIITITNGVTDDAYSYPQLKTELQQRNIRAINIIYPPMPEVTALPSLADATSGRNYMIAEVGAGQKGNSSTMAQLLSSLDDVVVSQSGNPYNDRVIVYEKVHATTEGNIKGNFIIDSSVGKDMKVTISYFKREDVFDVSLENPKRKFGSDDYDDKTEKQTISFAIKDGDAIIGIWNYAVKVNKHDDQPITVTVSAKPRRDFPIILRSWTNMGSRGINASVKPLVIHAELFQGSQPIVNARVRAVIERPKINNSFSFVELELLDNGSGAPDATKNDGVYTRYFTNYVDPVANFGFYSLSVYADDNDGRAQVVGDDKIWSLHSGILPKDPNIPFCCGSEAPGMLTEPTGPFQRFTSAPAFLVTDAPKQGEDVFPPSTIRDLKVDDVDSITGYITLSWTAPGEDYDFGTVSSLELHYSSDYKQLATDFDATPPVLEPIYPKEAGQHQLATFFAPNGRNQVYFFAIRAVDHVGLKSGVSNVVTCFVPPEPTTTTEAMTDVPITPSTSPSPIARPLLTAELIGIIVGCTVAFLLIVAIIVVLICINRRRRKLQEEKKTHHTIAQVHGPDVVRPPSTISGKEAEWKTGLPSEEGQEGHLVDGGNGVDGTYFSNSTLSPRQFVPASELLQHHDKHRSQAFNTVPHLNGNGNNILYHYGDETDSLNKHQQYPPYHPMEVVVDRVSISSKPSSYGSQQTAEVTSSSGYGTHAKDNGYINTSYEDGSENSNETARLRPETIPYMPLVSAPRRVLSESQV